MAVRMVVLCVALVAISAAQIAGAAETIPTTVKIVAPPFNSRFTCSIDKVSDPWLKASDVCHTNGFVLGWSYEHDVESSRYQLKTPVQLWKKGSKYVASFSAYFNFNLVLTQAYTGGYGDGIALAITPSLSVVGTNPDSFGLFPINKRTGAATKGAAAKTVAVEIDVGIDYANRFDPAVPHVGLDINSVKSVKTASLGSFDAFTDNVWGVWVDYNALTKTIDVYTLKVPRTQKPYKQNAKHSIRYTGLDLAKEVKEFSYVGLSSRTPIYETASYDIQDFKFSTVWVKGTTVNN